MSTTRDIARRGIMLVVSSPSGAGKTTLMRNLLEQEENVSLSISITTRPLARSACIAFSTMRKHVFYSSRGTRGSAH